MDFQRARNDEQRMERRRTILETAAVMLTEMPVADVSLNELSRRVALAKSNVLRYFESREAILLELQIGEMQEWVESLEASPVTSGPVEVRARAFAEAVAASFGGRRVLCDLISAQATVLERNVSVDVALRHKRAVGVIAQRFGAVASEWLPELSNQDLYRVVAHTFLGVSAFWPHHEPSESVKKAYELDADLAVHQTRMDETLTELLELMILGMLHRSVN